MLYCNDDQRILYACSSFVVSRNGSALLGMPDGKWLKLLTVKCQTTDNSYRKQQINEQTKYNRFKTKDNNKDNLCTNHKVNPEADYFAAGLNMETEKVKMLKQ